MHYTHETISGYFRLFLSDNTQGICRKFTFKDPVFTLFTKQLYSLVLFMRWALNYKDFKYFFIWQVKERGEKERF